MARFKWYVNDAVKLFKRGRPVIEVQYKRHRLSGIINAHIISRFVYLCGKRVCERLGYICQTIKLSS